MQPTILITRPEEAGVLFADQLRARMGCNLPIVLSPLMRIEACGNLPDLSAIKTLIFTSRNGVNAFAERSEIRDIPCYAVGDATAKAAKSMGFKIASANGAAEDLIDKITADNVSGPCLHIRGEHGTGAVADRLTAAGVSTKETILYRQKNQPATKIALDLLQNDGPVIVPLFSPRSAKLLFSEPRITARLWVAALSQNVANVVPNGQVRAVYVAKKPNADAMLDVVFALTAMVKSLEGGNLSQ